MTRKQRAQWWRELARDYENRTGRVQWFPEGLQKSICQVIMCSHGWQSPDRYELCDDMRLIRENTGDYWYSLDDDRGYDLRVLACCLIATLIESGDL